MEQVSTSLTPVEQELWRRGGQRYPWDLPIGVYIVSKYGRFIRVSRRLREILDIPAAASVENYSIATFYKDPHAREESMRRVDDLAKGEFREDEEIEFTVGDRDIWVTDTCTPERDEQGRVIGYFGVLADITQEVEYRRLVDQLPAGVYRVDSDENLVFVNRAVARMLGYGERESPSGPVAEVYVNPDQAQKVLQMVKREGGVKDIFVDLKRKDGTPISVNLSSRGMFGKDGTYRGSEGIIVDVTNEMRYRELLDAIPVGTFAVRHENGIELVSECNSAFARIFGYESPAAIIGTDARNLYDDRHDIDRLYRWLDKQDSQGIVRGFELRVRRKDGTPIRTEIFGHYLKNAQGEKIGRAGIVRDVSDEIALRELRDDIGRTLHVYSSTMMMVGLAQEATIAHLTRMPFGSAVVTTPEQADAIVDQTADVLRSKISVLLGPARTQHSLEGAVGIMRLKLLGEAKESLSDYKARIPNRQHRIVSLRGVAAEICGALIGSGPGQPRAGEIDDVARAAHDLERLCCLTTIWRASDRLNEMDYQVRALREYVIFHSEPEEEFTIAAVHALVAQAVTNILEYARWRKMDVTVSDECRGLLVRVREHQVLRALGNLLHNAVKYSWSGVRGEEKVRVRITSVAEQVHIAVSNYGVPITNDELARGLIFRIGYRGRLSGERGRTGTGVGLSDARQVARSQGGDVVLRSVSAARTAVLPGNYDGPFITTAVLTLPIFQEHEVTDEKQSPVD
jgi:PAS domain S-box-containing protein